MSFFSKISELFYDLFVTEPEEEEYIDSAGEDGKEAGPRMAGALPARAVRRWMLSSSFPVLIVMPAVRWMPWKKDL